MKYTELKNGFGLTKERYDELINLFYGFEEYFYYHDETYYQDYVKVLRLLDAVNNNRLPQEEINAIRGWFIYFQHGQRYMSNNGICFNITDACQLKCKHCFNQNTIRHNKFMDYDLFVNIFYKHQEICKKFVHYKPLKSYSDMMVWLKGGEAILHPECSKFLKFLNDNDVNFMLESNGIHMPEDVLFELKRRPSTKVQVSVDGMYETHDFIRGKGTFEKTLSTIKRLLGEGIKVHTNFCLNTYNYKDFNLYKTFFTSLGCDIGHLNYVTHSKEYFSSPNKEVFDYFKENNIKYPRRPLFSCNVPNQVVINYDGGWKCCDKSGFEPIASYVDDSVDEFVRKVKIFSLTHRCVPTYCHNCAYVQSCMGGEVCDNFFDTGCRNMSDSVCRELSLKKETNVYEIKLPIEYDSKYMSILGSCRPKFKIEE